MISTAFPKRKNKMAPKMVEIAVKNTGAVPNFFGLLFILNLFQMYRCRKVKKLYKHLLIINAIAKEIVQDDFFCSSL